VKRVESLHLTKLPFLNMGLAGRRHPEVNEGMYQGTTAKAAIICLEISRLRIRHKCFPDELRDCIAVGLPQFTELLD
jgi:hypothetical protein